MIHLQDNLYLTNNRILGVLDILQGFTIGFVNTLSDLSELWQESCMM